MRVAIVYDREDGGLPRVMLMIGRGLSARGHRVLVCGPFQKHRQWAEAAESQGVWIAPLPGRGLLWLPRSVERSLDAFHPQVLFSAHRGCDVRCADFAKKRGIPHVAVIHGDPTSPEHLQHRSIGFLKARNWLWRSALAAAAKVVCVSRFVADRAVEFGVAQSKIECVENAIDLQDFVWASPREPCPDDTVIRLLAVGRLSLEKNPLLFADLLSELERVGVDAVGKWVGDGLLMSDLAARARELGVTGRLETHGNDPVVEPHYRDADLFVYLRMTDHWGLVAAEALASGLPVVAFDTPGTRSIITNGVTGILARRGDIEEMALAVKKLVEAPQEYAAMSFAALESARRQFSIERFGREYAQILEEVAGP